MNIHNLLKDAKLTLSSGAVAAGTTAVDGGVIDRAAAGFDAHCAMASLGDVTATSVLQLGWRESDNSDGSSSTAVSGSETQAFTAGASDADSKLLVAECQKFTKRYIFPRLTRTTANAVVNSIITVSHKAHNKPVTQPSDVLASTLYV